VKLYLYTPYAQQQSGFGKYAHNYHKSLTLPKSGDNIVASGFKSRVVEDS